MSRRGRLWLFLAGAGGVAVLFVLSVTEMPPFGGHDHPYRDLAVPAALAHHTANVVAAVNFDQRGLDTLAEESILVVSVMAIATLLRKTDDEEVRPREGGRVLDATLLTGVLLLPVTLLLGFDVVAHGHLTPGGGFQGGVVAGTAVHLLYVAGRYELLHRVRPVRPFEWGEAIGTAAFASVGLAGTVVASAFLANFVATGSLGALFSSGTVGLLDGAVGVEVASSVIVVLSLFVDQAVGLRTAGRHHQEGTDG